MRRPDRRGWAGRVAVALALAAAVQAPSSSAAVVPTVTLDGPSPDVVDLGGVAMAPDGTGGVVYRRRVDGVPHVFAARYVRGTWQPPQRVDVGQQFASSWPRIVAAQGGTLRVVWVQEFGPGSDRLYASSAPDGGGFEPPWLVDGNVGEASATWPALASNAGGQTYLVYRVLGFTSQVGTPPPGYVAGQIRLARFRGPGWESLGILARNPATFVRAPSADNQPRIAVDATGDAVVAWQEPDDDFVDRIWARRVFSSGLGIPLLASPTSAGGAPVRGPADAFALGRGDFGEATVVARVEPADGSGGAPQLFVDSLPSMFDDGADAFAGARALGAPAAGLGTPAVASVDDAWTAAAPVGPDVLGGDGDGQTTGALSRIDDGSGGGTTDAAPAVVAGAEGTNVIAWRLTHGERSGVALRVTGLGGRRSSAVLSAPVGGPVDDLGAAGSGYGDALVAFRQGGDGNGAIAVGAVDGAPQPFHAFAPIGWVRARKARVAWETARDVMGRVRYALVVDGKRQRLQYTRSLVPYHGRLGDGSYRVAVVAIDTRGQETASSRDTLHVDDTPPTARVALRGRTVVVRVSDGRRGRVAGVRGGGTRVSFGDGSVRVGSARLAHRYRHPGRYRVRVVVHDRAGNAATLGWKVRVR